MLSLSTGQAAQDPGIARQGLHRILAARAATTPELALRFERLCGVPSRFWLERQHDYELLRTEAAVEDALSQIPQHPLPENIMAELDVK